MAALGTANDSGGLGPMATVQELARDGYNGMERATRDPADDRGDYYRVKDDAPDWLRDLVREAHGDMLPDDWRYDAIHSALEAIADSDDPEDAAHEFADSNADVYNADLVKWLERGVSSGYVDEARDEFGTGRDLMHELQMGQYAELSEVYGSVLSSLQQLAEDEDED